MNIYIGHTTDQTHENGARNRRIEIKQYKRMLQDVQVNKIKIEILQEESTVYTRKWIMIFG